MAIGWSRAYWINYFIYTPQSTNTIPKFLFWIDPLAGQEVSKKLQFGAPCMYTATGAENGNNAPPTHPCSKWVAHFRLNYFVHCIGKVKGVSEVHSHSFITVYICLHTYLPIEVENTGLNMKIEVYSVRGLEWSELVGSHGCPGRLWDRFLCQVYQNDSRHDALDEV